jgi:phosphatidate cytidylyltransferase
MLHNPLSSPLFIPTMQRIGALLLMGALLVGVIERRRLWPPRRLRESPLMRRVLSWALMAPCFSLAIFVGGPLSLLTVLYLIAQGLREFAGVTGMRSDYARVVLLLGAVSVITALLAPAAFPYLPVLALLLLSGFAVSRGVVDSSYRQLTAALFAYMYLPMMLSFFVLIGRHQAGGTAVLLLVGFGVALSDIIAFVAGTVFGGPRLAPRISPNKTVSGVLGSLIGAYLGLAVVAYALPGWWSLPLVLVLPALIALSSVGGDLLESLIKRSFAVKDAGAMLPGMGGLLDRIDSLIVAMPVTYLALRLAG